MQWTKDSLHCTITTFLWNFVGSMQQILESMFSLLHRKFHAFFNQTKNVHFQSKFQIIWKRSNRDLLFIFSTLWRTMCTHTDTKGTPYFQIFVCTIDDFFMGCAEISFNLWDSCTDNVYQVWLYLVNTDKE